MNDIKRHFYNNAEYHLDKINKRVTLSPQFFETLKNKKLWGGKGFKKIGGSNISNILKINKFKSDFQAFCHLSWIDFPILDRKYVDAGIAIEPKVINLIRKVTNQEVQTFNPADYNYDYFADKDDLVGGIPDGFIAKTATIIEVKTTHKKHLAKWRQYKPPNDYLRQAQLYAYLMEVKRFSIVATFLEEDDYLNPENYPIEKRVTKNWNYKVNVKQVEDDIQFVKDWYREYVLKGISPQYDENNDYDLVAWLDCSNEKEWLKLKEKWILANKLVL